MNEKSKHSLLEITAEIGYIFGIYGNDIKHSGTLTRDIIGFAKEFYEVYKKSNWNEDEFDCRIEEYVMEVTMSYIFHEKKKETCFCKLKDRIVVFANNKIDRTDLPVYAEIRGGGNTIRYYNHLLKDKAINEIEKLALEEYKIFNNKRSFPESDNNNIPIIYSRFDGTETFLSNDYWTPELIDKGERIHPNESVDKYLGLAKKIEFSGVYFSTSLIDWDGDDFHRFAITYKNKDGKTDLLLYELFSEALDKILKLTSIDEGNYHRFNFEYSIWVNDWQKNNPINPEASKEREEKFYEECKHYLKNIQKFRDLTEKEIEDAILWAL